MLLSTLQASENGRLRSLNDLYNEDAKIRRLAPCLALQVCHNLATIYHLNDGAEVTLPHVQNLLPPENAMVQMRPQC